MIRELPIIDGENYILIVDAKTNADEREIGKICSVLIPQLLMWTLETLISFQC